MIEDISRPDADKNIATEPKNRKAKNKARLQLWDSLLDVYAEESGVTIKNKSSKKVIKRDLDRNKIQPNQLLNKKKEMKFDNTSGKHLENTKVVLNHDEPEKNIDIKCKQKHKVMKKQQVEKLSLENKIVKSNYLTNCTPKPNIGDPKKMNQMVSSKREVTKEKIKKNKNLKEMRRLNGNQSGETWLSDGKRSIGHVESKKRNHMNTRYSKSMPYSESNKTNKNLSNEGIFSKVKSSILPSKEIINKLRCLPFKVDKNDLIFLDHKQLVKALQTHSKTSSVVDHSTGVLENNKPMTSHSVCNSKNVNAALQQVDAKWNDIQSLEGKQKKTHINKQRLKRVKGTTNHPIALSNPFASENIKDIPSKSKTNKKIKRKHFTIYKIKSSTNYKNCSDIKSSHKKPILKYQEDLIHLGNTKAYPKLNERHPVFIPHCVNNRVGNKSNASRNEHKLSTIFSDALEEEKCSSMLAVPHSSNAIKLNKLNSFDSDTVNQDKSCCQFPIIKDPRPKVKISNPLFSEHGKKLQFQLIKSFNRTQLKSNKKNINHINDEVERVDDQSKREGCKPSMLNEDHLMFIYANRESSSTSKESLNIAIRRDTEITNYGCSNDVLNVVIKQTKGSTSNIETSQGGKIGGRNLNCQKEPLKCIDQDDPSKNADEEILMKDTACQTEKIDLGKLCIIGASIKPCIEIGCDIIDNSINVVMANPINSEDRFLGKQPILNCQHKGVGVFSVNNKLQKPEVVSDKTGPKNLSMMTDVSFSNSKALKVNEFFTIVNNDLDSACNNTSNVSRENKSICHTNKDDLELELKPIGTYGKKGFIKILDSHILDSRMTGTYEKPTKDHCIVSCPKRNKSQEFLSDSDVNLKLDRVEIKIQDHSNYAINNKSFINSKKMRNYNLDNEKTREMRQTVTNKQRFCVVLPSGNVDENHCNRQNIHKNDATITSDSSDAVMEMNVSDIGIQTNLDSNLTCLKNVLLNLDAIHSSTNSSNAVIQSKTSNEHVLGNKTVNEPTLDMLCYNSRVVCGNVHSCGNFNSLALDDLISHQTLQCKPVIIPIINAVQHYLDKMLKNTLFISLIENGASHNVVQFNNALNGLLENCIDILQNMKIKQCKITQMNTTEYTLSNPLERPQFINVLKDAELQTNKQNMYLHDTKSYECFKINNCIQKHSLQSNIKPKPFFVVIPSMEKNINIFKDKPRSSFTKFKATQQSKVRVQKSSQSVVSADLPLNKKQIGVFQEYKTKPSQEKMFINEEKTVKVDVNLKKLKDIQNEDVSTPSSLTNPSNKHFFQPYLKSKGAIAQTYRKQLKYAGKSKSIHSVYSQFKDVSMYHINDTSAHIDRLTAPNHKDFSFRLGLGDISNTRNENEMKGGHWNNKATVKYNDNLNGSKFGFANNKTHACDNIFDLKYTCNNLKLKPSISEVHEKNSIKKPLSTDHLRLLLRNTDRNGYLISNSSPGFNYHKDKFNQDINDHIANNHNKPLIKHKISEAKQSEYTKYNTNPDINHRNYSRLKGGKYKDLASNKFLKENKTCEDTTGSSLVISQSNELLNDLENVLTFDELAAKVNDWKNKSNKSSASKPQNQSVPGIKGSLNAGNNIQTVRRFESDTDLTKSNTPGCFNQQTRLMNSKMTCNLPQSTKQNSNTKHLDRLRFSNNIKLKTKTKKGNNKSIFTVKYVGSESSISSSFSLPKKSMLFINSCHPSIKYDTLRENSFKPHNEDINKKIYNIKYSTNQHSTCDINSKWISLSDCSLQTLNTQQTMFETKSQHGEANNNLRLQMDVKMNDIMHVEFFCQPTEYPSDFQS